MPETQRLLEQEDSIQESYNEKIRVAEGGCTKRKEALNRIIPYRDVEKRK